MDKKPNEIPKKIAFNSIISSIAKVAWTLISIISHGLITRLLGKEKFGEYSTVLTLVFLLNSIGDLGLNQITSREISRPKHQKKEPKIISTVLALRILASIVLILISVILYFFLNYNEELKKGIVIVTFGSFFALSYQALNGIFQKRLNSYLVSGAEFLGRVTNLVWVIICFQFKLGLIPVLFGMILSWTVTFLVVFFFAKRTINFSFKINKKEAKRLLKLSIPVGISSIVTFLYFRADTLILSKLQSMEDVGIYGAAYKIIENLSYFPSMFMGLILPIFSRNIFSKPKKFRRMANKTFDAVSIISIGLCFGILSLADEIIPIVSGSAYSASIEPLKILSFAIIGLFFGHFFNIILIVSDQQKKLLMIFIAAAILNLLSNFIFIPQYSYFASSIISSLTELFVPFVGAILVYKTLKYKPNLKAFIKSAFAGIIMFFVLKLIDFSIVQNYLLDLSQSPLKEKIIFTIFTFAKILIGATVYLFIAFLLKTITKNDIINLLPNRLKGKTKTG